MVDLIYYVIFTSFTSLHVILFQLMALIYTFYFAIIHCEWIFVFFPSLI